MQRYLKSIEDWFNKWRKTKAGKKCSFKIYSKGPIPKELSSGEFKLFIFNEAIPVNHNPKYLGINLDRNLNFKYHTELVREKLFKLLNIIKCLTFKKWSLSTERLINVYKVLIRSTMEYVPQLLLVNGENIERLHGVQYKALQILLKESPRCSNLFIHHLSQIETIHDRIYSLSEKYFEKNILK
ncbi:RNA-directed DNA polymerase from mobile element jockey-like [Brachionus plicatilis]|uniref:RNA-directed DNA polymerase from mobile element jockey-like n=1 Tax=Brachionus plicatilis TaxID=10195 RepID=A0A3M7T6Z2_BRAPC|nr:RNA-directed DNA polymerase from mobile element jockey-like [Brachionus plicatilis]